MKNSLNIFYYSLYILESKAHYLFNKINPGLLLYKIPRIKKRLKKQLETDDPEEWLNNFWTDKNSGFGHIFIGGWLIGLLSLFFISLGIIVVELFDLQYFQVNRYYFFLCGIVSYLTSYFLVFKNDQYVSYFKKYENWEKSEKRKKVLSSLLIIIGVISLFFLSILYFL